MTPGLLICAKLEDRRNSLDYLASMPSNLLATRLYPPSPPAKRVQLFADLLRKFVTPKIAAFFAGVGNWKKASFLEGLIGKMVKAPEGDFRDWPAIPARAQPEAAGSGGTLLSLCSDQAGLIGFIRQLHDLGFVLLSLTAVQQTRADKRSLCSS